MRFSDMKIEEIDKIIGCHVVVRSGDGTLFAGTPRYTCGTFKEVYLRIDETRRFGPLNGSDSIEYVSGKPV